MHPAFAPHRSFVVSLHSRLPASILSAHLEHGELTLTVAPASLAALSRELKDRERFVRLSSATAVDWYPVEPRFEVVYHLHSIEQNRRLRLRCLTGGPAPALPSVVEVWSGADWYEREIFDLFGVRFEGHPRLTRILLPDDWEGHPLRKDFPVHGHKYDYKNE